jgi:hypothetical protein
LDYFDAAFGGFRPHIDKDAAIKFILDVILADGEFEALSQLVPEGGRVATLEGVPGWWLSRRDPQEQGWPGQHWPEAAEFRAYVDPEDFELAYPEFYMDRPLFQSYLQAALKAYVARNPMAVEDPYFSALVRRQ